MRTSARPWIEITKYHSWSISTWTKLIDLLGENLCLCCLYLKTRSEWQGSSLHPMVVQVRAKHKDLLTRKSPQTSRKGNKYSIIICMYTTIFLTIFQSSYKIFQFISCDVRDASACSLPNSLFIVPLCLSLAGLVCLRAAILCFSTWSNVQWQRSCFGFLGPGPSHSTSTELVSPHVGSLATPG